MGKKMFLKYSQSSYYPVDKYNLLVYNNFGYKGSQNSTKNIRLRNSNTNDEQDFLFDGSAYAKAELLNFADGHSLRVVKLYNEGVGGASYDLIQNTINRQPIIDTTNWLIDFDVAGIVFLSSEQISPITDNDSMMMVSFKSQSTTDLQGVLTEQKGSGNNRVTILSDNRSTNFRIAIYAPDGNANTMSFTSQQPTLNNNVYSLRKVLNDVDAYDNTSKIDSITSSDVFDANTNIEFGRQLSGNAYFKGQTKGCILHNEALTESILFELSNHLAI